jgi:hypothetical protein
MVPCPPNPSFSRGIARRRSSAEKAFGKQAHPDEHGPPLTGDHLHQLGIAQLLDIWQAEGRREFTAMPVST